MDEIDRVLKKKKNKKITELRTLLNIEAEREYFLNLLDDNRKTYIKECLEYYPKI
jgi:transcription initiation factor IIE alpha subunit